MATTYRYNAEGQMSCGMGINYSYDGDGVRVGKSGGDSTATLYWGAGTLAESDASGNLTSEYIFLGGRRIARRDVATGNVHYYFADALGSSNVVATAAGAVENESDFLPFGGELAVTQGLANQHYKFEGHERDAESASLSQPQGLDNFGARFDSSSAGRFMSPDWANKPEPVPYAKLGNPQSLNLYAFAQNNPESAPDLDGHDTLAPPPAAYGGYAGAVAWYTQIMPGGEFTISAVSSGGAKQQDQTSGTGNAVPKPDHFTLNLDGWSNPTHNVERGCDAPGGHNCGYFGAHRDEGHGDTHLGADYLGNVGQAVYALRTGSISSIGYAYPNSSLRMIHISTYDGYSIGVGYASPAGGIHRGSFVVSGQAIGIMQNVQDVVGRGTSPHIHIQIDFNGTRINPETVVPAPFRMTF